MSLTMRFRAGERVQVSPDHHWAGGAIGTIAAYPDFIADAATGDLVDETTMSVPALQGPIDQTWVVFDEPQLDDDGDGPYAEAAIDCAMLMRAQ